MESWRKTVIAASAAAVGLIGAANAAVGAANAAYSPRQMPVVVHSANAGVIAADAGMAEDGRSVTLAWKAGGEQPVVAYDYGGRSVGGYAVFKVTGFKAQGRNAVGKAVGFPVLRLSYCTHPDGLRETGDFTRRGCIDYLGPTFDNPVLPANVNRFELYTITREGVYVAPLLQGQERYVRVQLETPGTEVSVDAFELRNAGVFSREEPVGTFRCSDERVNRTWDMSAWTCRIASIPNNDAWHVVAGQLLPRKLERGSVAGFAENALFSEDGSVAADFELRTNPHFDSAIGLMLKATDDANGVVVVASQPAVVSIYARKDGVNTLLVRKIVDEPIVDGVRHRLEARVSGGTVTAVFDGVKLVTADIGKAFPGGRFGLYVEKEWWPVVHGFQVTDAQGKTVFADDFSKADDEGRLPGWDYTRSFQFMADGAKRDRLVWIGDLWWAARTCFYAYAPDWPYFRESLRLLAYYQNPEGYVWAAPFSEKGPRTKSGEYGHFPSDEFSAWFVPILWDYYLYTGNREVAEELYPTAKRDIDYLSSRCSADGMFVQRIETSSNVTCMPPNDPSVRLFTHLVIWRAFVDGASLAKSLGREADAADFTARAAKLEAAIRRNFRDPKTGEYFAKIGVKDPRPSIWGNSMALGSGFLKPEESLASAIRVPVNGTSKGHLVGLRGKFRYGYDESAFDMIEGGAWFALSDPKWAGAQCCTECGFLTRDGVWDESHPDTAVAGPISTYLLGVVPVEPGFRRFSFAPHVVTRLSFAEGKVPTPHGFVSARWDRKDGVVTATLEVPDGTEATVDLPRASAVKVDGQAYAGGPLGSGRHVIEAQGMDDKALADKSIAANAVTDASGETWLSVAGSTWTRSSDPNFEFVQMVDLGAVCDVRTLELIAAGADVFPAEIRIETSADRETWTVQKDLTALAWPGAGKKITVDMRTAGSSLSARYVRLAMSKSKGVPGKARTDEIVYYRVVLQGIRVKYAAE